MEVKKFMSTEMVISGMGVISPLGTEKERFLQAFGQKGISSEEQAKFSGMEPGRLTDLLGIRDPKLKIARYLDPTAKNVLVALDITMADAGIRSEDIAADPYGYGIVLGAVRGPRATRLKAYEMLRAKGGKILSSTLFSNFGYNIAGAMAAIAHGVKGPNLTISGKDDLALSLFRRARQLLQGNRAHTIFCGFSEADGATFDPQRPFSESACIFCLELEGHARQRRRAGLFRVTASEIQCRSRFHPPDGLTKGVVQGEDSPPAPVHPNKGGVQEEAMANTLGLQEEFMPFIRLGMCLFDREGISEGQCSHVPVMSRSGGGFLSLAPSP
jgi:hypothetical protein